MKCFYVFIFFTTLIFFAKSVESAFAGSSHVDGYYWRDYTGHIPNDAVQAGRDENGEVTYIGQALHPGGHLTPGFIKQNNNFVFYEYGNVENAGTEDVKILCSRNQERLTWIRVNSKESTNNLNGAHLIIAGHDNAGPLAIGRKAKQNDEVAVGKVLIVGTEFRNLYTTRNKQGHTDSTYEVLVYKTVSTKDQGYYWREYTGYIPRDAVPAGRDENGETTFIGQALHPGGHLTPGFIKQKNNRVFYEFGNVEREATEDVKILCSRNRERLSWIKVNAKESTNSLVGVDLIIGGHDTAGPLAIGRIARQSTEVAVGKVLIVDAEFRSLYITQNKVGHVVNSYEVLVCKADVVEDQEYYWKDYTGHIPKDAIPAGRDQNGETTFIGQAVHPDGFLTPGFIKMNDNHVYCEFGGIERPAIEHAKILCSQNLEKLMWIKVNYGQSTNNLHNKQIVIGGREATGPLAIGRIKRENNEIGVGKILLVGTECGYLYTTENKTMVRDSLYEMLVYKTPVVEENAISPNSTVLFT